MILWLHEWSYNCTNDPMTVLRVLWLYGYMNCPMILWLYEWSYDCICWTKSIIRWLHKWSYDCMHGPIDCMIRAMTVLMVLWLYGYMNGQMILWLMNGLITVRLVLWLYEWSCDCIHGSLTVWMVLWLDGLSFDCMNGSMAVWMVI